MNDLIIETLFNNYNHQFPDHMILGGFSTDKELFNDLYILYDTINDIHSKSLVNKNKLLLLLDPFHQDSKVISYGAQVYNWKYESDLKVMSFKSMEHQLVDLKIKAAALHSSFTNKEEILLNMNSDVANLDEKNFSGIVDMIKRSVDEELKYQFNSQDYQLNNVNLKYLKKQLLTTERFLFVIEKYLDSDNANSLNNELLHKIDMLLNDLTHDFSNSELLEVMNKEFKNNQLIESLTNLLNLQLKITEKINKFNV